MASLFGQYQRTDPSPKRHSESAYQFVDRSARPNVSAVRALVESWFGAYPKAQQAELQGRFVADFYAAFFELFLYSYFKNGGYEVSPHPQVAGSTRKPDYLVEKDGCIFYLEAIIARDLSDEEAAKESVKNLLLDAINATQSPNFFLHLREFTVVPGKQPSARKIRAFLKRELATIDPDSVDVSQLARPLFDGPGLTYQDETITISITLMPRSPAARGRTDIRPIGVYPMASRWGGSDALIRDAVKSKATRYGELDLPYVVAVNCISEWGVDDEDIFNALFGTEQFGFAQGSPTPVPSRRRDGALIGPNGPWNTRVSAVLVSTLFPWNLGSCRLELYHNPWAAKPLGACSFALRQGTVLDGSVTWSGATELLSHFGLEPGWPDNSAG